jgi:hypothetical protein
MEKEFAPYELSLALKELGFDEPCFGYYNTDPYLGSPAFNLVKPFDHEWCLPAPLYQQAFRWFREKYELVVDWNHSQHDNFGSYFGFCVKNIHLEGIIVGVYKTYEEAELECLKKLIEITKRKIT